MWRAREWKFYENVLELTPGDYPAFSASVAESVPMLLAQDEHPGKITNILLRFQASVAV